MINKLRYTLIHRLNRDIVQPLGEANLSIEWNENDDDFYENYEKSLGGNLVLSGEPYQTLLTYENTIYRCEPLSMLIERKCVDSFGNPIWKELFKGDFLLNDAKWNLEDCYVEITFLDEDVSECLTENKNEEINLFEIVGQRHNVTMSEGNTVYEFKDFFKSETITQQEQMNIGEYWNEGLGGMSIEEARAKGWRAWKHHYRYETLNVTEEHEPAGFEYLLQRTTNWIRQVVTIDCDTEITDPSLVLIEDKCSVNNTKIYAKQVNLFNIQHTESFGENPTYWIEHTYEYSYYGSSQQMGNLEFKNGILLNEVIIRLIQRFCPSLQVISDFFQINPENQTNINYVTSERTYTDYLMLFQKSDIKRPNAYNVATKANWTFDKLIEYLYMLFNVKYDIYDNILRLEHYSYFQKELGLDLTEINNSQYLIGSKKYSYKTDEIPNREKWVFKEKGVSSVDYFSGMPIIYNSRCVKKNKEVEKTFNIEDVVTDVELVISNPASDSNVVKDDGFVLMATRFNSGGFSLVTMESLNNEPPKLNNALAMPKLHQDFWKHGRYLDSGLMNGEQTTFYLTRPTKMGEAITIPMDCNLDFDPRKTIRTYFGDGVVSKATFNNLRSHLTLELKYPVEGELIYNEPPVAVNDTAVLYENQSILIDVLQNDSDEKDLISGIVISQQGTKGIAVVENNKIRYTANTGQLGNDIVKYYITDEWNQPSNIANIGILIRAENESPVANNDYYTMNMGGVLNVSSSNGIFKNDSDDFGYNLDFYSSTSEEGFPVIVNPDGSFIYSPSANFYGFDSFTYRIKDDQNLTANAVVFIEVINPDMPRTNPDTYQTRRGQILNVNGSNLLLNKVLSNDVNGANLTCVVESKSTSSGGNVSINSDGAFTYTPPSNFVGIDSFTYTSQNSSGSASGEVIVKVLPNIYVSMEERNRNTESIDINCGGNMQLGGVIDSADYYVRFWSDIAKTIPMDITGLGLRILYEDKQVIEGVQYSYENVSIEMSGTEQLLTHKNLLYRQMDCNLNVIMEVQESVNLKQTNGYVI